LLMAADRLGVTKAQELTNILDEDKLPWNEAFKGRPIMASENGELPTKRLDGDMTLTILSPYRQQLVDLIDRWEAELLAFKQKKPHLIDRVAGDYLGGLINVKALAESDFKEDTKEPNGSSIALLADYGGRRVLLGADAFPSVVEKSVRKLAGSGRLEVDAFKVCHHGSKGNTSRGLVESLSARSYLISTSGNRHHHPDREGVARLIWYGVKNPTLWFNYESECNRAWGDGLSKLTHRYSVRYPSAAEAGIVMDLS
jgi:hypothetical protein